MQKFAEMNVAELAIAATVVVIVGVVGLFLLSPSASAATQPGSSPTAASVGWADSQGARRTMTERGIRFSFKVPRRCAGWERHSSYPAASPPEGRFAQQVRRGPAGRRSLIYWTSFPKATTPIRGTCAEPSRSIRSRSRGRSVESGRHQAPRAAFERDPGRTPREAPGAHRSQERRLRPRVLLYLATVKARCVLVYDGHGRHGPFWIVAVGGKRLFIAAATKAGGMKRDPADRRVDPLPLAMSEFHHGHGPRAEEIGFIRSTSRSRGRSTRPGSKGTRPRLVASRRSSSGPRRAGSRPTGESPAGARPGRSSSASAPAYEVRYEELVTPDELLVILRAIRLAV